jgi:intracellular sulfur oxidation DsrE/DsrF family protein
MSSKQRNQTSRRGFLGSIATGAAAMGIASLSPLQQLQANPETSQISNPGDPEKLFKDLNGKHRIVFDVVEPVWMLPFAWPRVFLLTNMATGTPEKENSIVVVLRHAAIPYAFEDRLWDKYKFADLFKVKNEEGQPVTKNAFWKPAPGTFNVPGFGVVPLGINELQDSGVKFVVCGAAMTVYSAAHAMQNNLNATDVRKDWESGVLPGITIVPSGVWAVGRAQENKCAYCYASAG